MHADDFRDPTRTTLRTSNFADGTVEFLEIHFAAASAVRLESAQDAGPDQFIPGCVGQPAQLIGFAASIA